MLTGDRFSPITNFVPDRYREAVLAQLSPDLRDEVCDRKPSRGALFYGATGRGKTHAMAAIANTMRESGDFAARGWVDWAEFCRDVRAYWDLSDKDGSKRFFDPIAWAVRQPALFIDDLGQERDTQSDVHFQAVVAGRYDARRGLFVTTNLSPDEITERYGARVSSRLGELCTWIELGGVDRRVA